MKIAILTSSRADFGIYTPLIKELIQDTRLRLDLVIFGMHTQNNQGLTQNEIFQEFPMLDKHIVQSNLGNNSRMSVATEYAETVSKFNSFWNSKTYDYVLCLGDRYEMSAAVQSGVFFGVKFIHVHGGETTLGAIDNIFRHQITMASSLHLTTTEGHKDKVSNIVGNSKNVFNVGSLSLSEIKNTAIKSLEEFKKEFDLLFSNFVLFTYHPATSSNDSINHQLEILEESLLIISRNRHLIITSSNSDEDGDRFNHLWLSLSHKRNNITFIKSLGKKWYFTAMSHASFVAGNTSSGIIESASFQKYFVNIGDRQKGRDQSKNVINVELQTKSIISAFIEADKPYQGRNRYYKENTINDIKSIINKLFINV